MRKSAILRSAYLTKQPICPWRKDGSPRFLGGLSVDNWLEWRSICGSENPLADLKQKLDNIEGISYE